MVLKYIKADAFTGEKSAGNPAASIYLAVGKILDDDLMLKIAKQHKGFVSEVIFCTPLNISVDYELRYFSSECEVTFCGHGTVACMYSLIKDTPQLLDKKIIKLKTQAGNIDVFNEVKKQDAVFITAPDPIYKSIRFSKSEIANGLNISTKEINNDYPIEIINAGLNTLIVPIVNLDSEVKALPDEKVLLKFLSDKDIDIVLIYSLETSDKKHIVHTRVFAPKFGYLEDPATGSGNSSMAYYMLKNNMWQGEDASIEQGNIDGAFNIIKIKTQNCDSKKKVLFGGKASIRIRGEYFI